MTILDYGVFMVAGIVGSLAEVRIAFAIIGVWGLLKLLHVI